jgi:hypothetical protein
MEAVRISEVVGLPENRRPADCARAMMHTTKSLLSECRVELHVAESVIKTK